MVGCAVLRPVLLAAVAGALLHGVLAVLTGRCCHVVSANVRTICTYFVCVSASTKEFLDRDHMVVDKYLHTYNTYALYNGPLSEFAASPGGHSLFDRTKTENGYENILWVSQRLYFTRMQHKHSWAFILIYLVF